MLNIRQRNEIVKAARSVRSLQSRHTGEYDRALIDLAVEISAEDVGDENELYDLCVWFTDRIL